MIRLIQTITKTMTLMCMQLLHVCKITCWWYLKKKRKIPWGKRSRKMKKKRTDDMTRDNRKNMVGKKLPVATVNVCTHLKNIRYFRRVVRKV